MVSVGINVFFNDLQNSQLCDVNTQTLSCNLNFLAPAIFTSVTAKYKCCFLELWLLHGADFLDTQRLSCTETKGCFFHLSFLDVPIIWKADFTRKAAHTADGQQQASMVLLIK